jgi:hypothetical protein
MRRKYALSLTTVAIISALIFPVAGAQAATVNDNSNDEVTPTQVEELDALREMAGQPTSYGSSADPVSLNRAGEYVQDPFVCTIYPSVVHLRKSGNYETVGAKPYTRCLAGIPEKLTHRSRLFMVEWAGLAYVQVQDLTQVGNWVANLTFNSFEWTCENTNNSKFMQVTNGTALENGTTYYSGATAPVTEDIACGK